MFAGKMRFLPLFFVAAVLGAADAQYTYWNSTQLRGYEKDLKGKMNDKKTATQNLTTAGNSFTMVAHREGDGEAEVHNKVADYFVVQSGEATLVHGGQVVAGKTTAPDEIRGQGIDGGEKQPLKPGDIVYIPSKMPHQLLISPGKQFTYFVVKVKD